MSELAICETVWMQFLMEGMEVPDFKEFVEGYKQYESEKNGDFK